MGKSNLLWRFVSVVDYASFRKASQDIFFKKDLSILMHKFCILVSPIISRHKNVNNNLAAGEIEINPGTKTIAV
jgi:hypothetical protein